MDKIHEEDEKHFTNMCIKKQPYMEILWNNVIKLIKPDKINEIKINMN